MKNKDSFIKGTIILMFANTISKILGAIFKIPITYVLKEEGMAIFNTAMSAYSMVLSFIISGFPFALMQMVSKNHALNHFYEIKKSVKITTVILFFTSLLASITLFFFSDFFAYSMKDPKASYAIKAISPALFFVALATIYKSYFQGLSNMIPTAISQITEAIIKLFAGFLIALFLNDKLLEIKSAGAVFGITLGEIIATFILYVMFIKSNKKLPQTTKNTNTKDIFFSLSRVAIPMLMCSCIFSMINLLDVATLRNCLLNIKFTPSNIDDFLIRYSSHTTVFDDILVTQKMSVDGARWLYGAYSGYALTIFHLPTGLIGALSSAILPLINASIAKNDRIGLNKTISDALLYTLLIVLPSSLILFAFSEEILYILFKNTASSHLLKALSPCLIFLCVGDIFTLILHSHKKIFEPFLYGVIALIIKILLNHILVPIPKLNILGTVISSGVAFLFIMVMNIHLVKRIVNFKIKAINIIIKPIISTFIMGIVLYLIKNPILMMFRNNIISLSICIFTSFVTYILSLLSFNTISLSSFKLRTRIKDRK